MKKVLLLFFISFLIFQNPAFTQSEAEELAKKLANPIASLISVPLQNNTDYGIGEFRGSRNTMNIQPVVPIGINENWNLIGRVILPVITQNNITGEGEKQSGIGDAVVSAFFSPTNSEKLIWGAGPAFVLPTGSNNFLTADQFGLGPTAVALKQINGFTVGGLINQIWGVSGNTEKPDLNQMFFQPFLVYNWKSGAGVGGNMEWVQNWTSSAATIWINPTISGVTSLGKQKVQLVLGPRFNVASPEGAKADIGWRAVFVFLFPK